MIKNDKLDVIFKLQGMLDEDIIKNRNLSFSKEEWMQKKILATLSELSELLAEVNFKWWKNKKELNFDNISEELTDILHFFVSMCLTAGLTADGLFEKYKSKNKENFDRQYGLSEKKGYEFKDSLNSSERPT